MTENPGDEAYRLNRKAKIIAKLWILLGVLWVLDIGLWFWVLR